MTIKAKDTVKDSFLFTRQLRGLGNVVQVNIPAHLAIAAKRNRIRRIVKELIRRRYKFPNKFDGIRVSIKRVVEKKEEAKMIKELNILLEK